MTALMNVELERVPDPDRRPRPKEKLVVNKPNTTRAQISAKPRAFMQAQQGSDLFCIY